MRRLSGICSLVFTLLMVTFKPIWAVTVQISNVPTEVNYDQDFEVDVFLDCKSCSGDSYMRTVFYPDGSNYFGYTLNQQGEWINEVSDKTRFFRILQSELNEGTWSGKLRTKIDPNHGDFNGTGSYMFKVLRYTAGGSTSPAASEITHSTIMIIGPTPTPTPSPTSASTPTATPTPTSSPTPSPTATVTRPLTSSPSPPAETPSNSKPEINTTPTPSFVTELVLSASITTTPPTPPEVNLVETSRTPRIIGWIAIVLGLLILIGASILALKTEGRQISWISKLQEKFRTSR